jgi:hypothetical protein
MDVNVLRDSYGYTVSDPADALGNFYVVQDETGTLTVRGGPQGANFDNINLVVQTAGVPVIPTVFAQVVVRNPAPGTTLFSSFGVYNNFPNVRPLNAVKAIALQGGGSTLFVDVSTANSTGRSLAPVSITNTGELNVNILASGGPVAINGAGSSTVNLGNAANGVQSILGAVNIQNSGGYSAVNVDAAADKSARTVIIYNNGPANGSYTVIDGLPTGGTSFSAVPS